MEIDVQGIKLEDKKICELKEIDRVFLYKDFFLLITNEKKLLVLKTVGVETEELIKIIKEADILFEKEKNHLIFMNIAKAVIKKKKKRVKVNSTVNLYSFLLFL